MRLEKWFISNLDDSQRQIIVRDPNENLIVQGAAGSGKTNLAIHRAVQASAYSDSYALVVYTRALKRMVAYGLDELGLDKERIAYDWAWDHRGFDLIGDVYCQCKITTDVNGYPKIFQSLYNDYKAGKKTLEGLKLEAKWQPLPIETTFVVKWDTTNLDYSIPPYLNIYAKLYLLDEYEALNLAKTTAENYTLIGLKIPRNEDGKVDSYSVSNDMIDMTTFMLDQSLPDYMGYFTTPTDIEVVKGSSASDKSIDNVDRATKTMWNSLGLSEAMFGVENTTEGTLSYSIKADEQQLFSIYRQIERHYDYKFKEEFKNMFKFVLLDTTWFNINELFQRYMSSAQFSVPVAIIIPLLLGFDITDINDLPLYQDEIFNIYETWRALESSYTNTGDEGGRPTNKEQSDNKTDSNSDVKSATSSSNSNGGES